MQFPLHSFGCDVFLSCQRSRTTGTERYILVRPRSDDWRHHKNGMGTAHLAGVAPWYRDCGFTGRSLKRGRRNSVADTSEIYRAKPQLYERRSICVAERRIHLYRCRWFTPEDCGTSIYQPAWTDAART